MVREDVKLALESYEKISKKTFTQVTTTQLNVLYNIVCRAKRDEEYRLELEKLDTGVGDTLVELIEKYFAGYNTRHGLDIRETLTEFVDPEFASGAYFIVKTYIKGSDGKLTERAPTEFSSGEVAYVRATLRSHASDEPVAVDRLVMKSVADGEVSTEVTVRNSHTIEFELTCKEPGAVKFNIAALDGQGKGILGCETAYGGVLFSWREIKAAHTPPSDLEEFWRGEIDRLMKVDPTDTASDGYSGRVSWAFGMPKKNHFSITKFTEEYHKMLHDNGYNAPPRERLESHDSYELNLKAPGPCHASGYLSIPKVGEKKSMPIMITVDGYSAYAPMPVYHDKYIRLHSSHHGYEMGKPASGYYFNLSRGGILTNYGRANGEINSDYKDIHDCYMVYLHLRNMQMIRFVTDPALSGFIENLHEYWNGEIMLSGGSMGGYQTAMLSALYPLLRERCAPFKLVSARSNITAFCNLAGRTVGRIPTKITRYEAGMDYFDPATLAHLIETPFVVTRSGLGDETCPSSSIIAFFNSIRDGVPREIRFLQNSSHGYVPDEEVQMWYKYRFDASGDEFEKLIDF
ncbi:MAG: hypothetical protein IJ459_01430 [Clostridia bacterium]|nr:hypothetical protein [Clostridia bacterium]